MTITLDSIREHAHNFVPMAIRDAWSFHHADVRKDGTPYLSHLFRVAADVADDPAAVCLAMLHDLVEDHGDELNPSYLPDCYGAEFYVILDALTHRTAESEPRAAYLTRVIRAGPVARRVKLADVTDNYTHLDRPGISDADRVRLTGKYEGELAVLAPLVAADSVPAPTLTATRKAP